MELKPCPFCGKSVAHCGTIAEHEYTDEDSVFSNMIAPIMMLYVALTVAAAVLQQAKDMTRLNLPPKHGTGGLTMDKAAKCKNCARRRMYAICFDIHFDWLDCPFVCEVKEEDND